MLASAASRLASARAARAATVGAVGALAAARPPPLRRRLAAPARIQYRNMASAAAAAASASAGSGPGEQQQGDGDDSIVPPELQLVQYVVLRRDLWRVAGASTTTQSPWPLGPVVAQGAHAATAALSQALRSGSAHAERYCSPQNVGSMRKVVLEVEDERRLRAMAERLSGAGVGHWLWVEQPEGYATALATWPAPRGEVAPHVKKGKLCKPAIGGDG